MAAFKTSTYLFLALHAAAGVLLMISVLGTPGNPDESNTKVALLLKIWEVLLILAWKGIPYLIFASLAAFFFGYETIGKIICLISLALGVSLFLTVLIYYTVFAK